MSPDQRGSDFIGQKHKQTHEISSIELILSFCDNCTPTFTVILDILLIISFVFEMGGILHIGSGTNFFYEICVLMLILGQVKFDIDFECPACLKPPQWLKTEKKKKIFFVKKNSWGVFSGWKLKYLKCSLMFQFRNSQIYRKKTNFC